VFYTCGVLYRVSSSQDAVAVRAKMSWSSDRTWLHAGIRSFCERSWRSGLGGSGGGGFSSETGMNVADDIGYTAVPSNSTGWSRSHIPTRLQGQ